MKYRLLRLFLFASAFAWGISAVGVILPWSKAVVALEGLGAGHIQNDPMLNYWLRMASGAFTGVGIFILILAIDPKKFTNIIGLVGLLQVFEGIILLIHGLRLGLAPFPFYSDTLFCLLVGAGIFYLRDEAVDPK